MATPGYAGRILLVDLSKLKAGIPIQVIQRAKRLKIWTLSTWRTIYRQMENWARNIGILPQLIRLPRGS